MMIRKWQSDKTTQSRNRHLLKTTEERGWEIRIVDPERTTTTTAEKTTRCQIKTCHQRKRNRRKGNQNHQEKTEAKDKLSSGKGKCFAVKTKKIGRKFRLFFFACHANNLMVFNRYQKKTESHESEKYIS